MLCKDTVFAWTEKCDAAFEQLRNGLCSPPILAYPDFSKPFILTTDASNTAIGGILGQVQDGKERVIQYAGRSLKKHERQYTITEKEGLAVIYSLKVFDPYLRNSKFTIITDHQALKYIFSEKENTGSRVAWWAMALQQYDYDIVHRAGRVNENADALSRRHYDTEGEDLVVPPAWNNMLMILPKSKASIAKNACASNPDPQTDITADPDRAAIASIDSDRISDDVTNDSPILSHSLDNLKKLQQADPFCCRILDLLVDGKLPNDPRLARKTAIESENYAFVNWILYHFWFSDRSQKRKDRCYQQVVVPAALREEVLASLHDEMTAGHQGFTRTLLSIKCRFYWDSMAYDVENWVKSCRTCASRNRPSRATKAPMILREVASSFDTIVIDLVGPLKRSKKWILSGFSLLRIT